MSMLLRQLATSLTRITRRRRPSLSILTTPHAHFSTTGIMSDLQTVFTGKATAPVGPYSQAVVAGGQIYVSGQLPADAQGNLIEGTIAQKTEAACKNIAAILDEAGSAISRVVKVNIFLDDMAHFAEVNGVYEKFFAHKPARSCIAAKALPKGVPLEIECIALAGKP